MATQGTGFPAAFIATLVTKGLRGTRASLLRWPLVIAAGLGASTLSANKNSEKCLVRLLSLPEAESALASEGRRILLMGSPESRLWRKPARSYIVAL